MGSQTNQASLATSIISAAQQTINNYCSIACNANIGNVNITVIGGNATIDVSQTCTNIGSECTIKNLMSSEITNLIDNIVKQSQTNAGFLSLLGPSQSNTTNISNAIKNQISQLVNNTCTQDATVNVNAINVFSQDANLKFNYNQTGTTDHATCALDTTVKLLLNNQVTNSVTQKQSSCGNVLLILIIIAVIILVILLFPILSNLFRGSGGGSKGGSSSNTEVVVVNTGDKAKTETK